MVPLEATVSTRSAAGPQASGAETFLRSIHLHQRRSLDRAKFWNTCAQSLDLPLHIRQFSREQREREAEHRTRLKQLRRVLTKHTSAAARRVMAGHVAELAACERASAALTELFTRFLRAGPVDPLPDWVRTLRSRSPWLDSLVEEATEAHVDGREASGRTSPGSPVPVGPIPTASPPQAT